MKRKLKQLLVTMLSIAMIATMSGITSFNSKAAGSNHIKSLPFTVTREQDNSLTVTASISAFPTQNPDCVPYHWSICMFEDPDVADMAYSAMEDILVDEGWGCEDLTTAGNEQVSYLITYSGYDGSLANPVNSTNLSITVPNIEEDVVAIFVLIWAECNNDELTYKDSGAAFYSIAGNKDLPTEKGGKGGNNLGGDPDDPAPAPVPMTEHEAHLSKASIDPVKNTDGSYNMTVFGIPQFKCSICGEIHQDYSKAQEVWFDEILKSATDHSNLDSNWKHSEAEVGKPVNITTRTFYSFDKATLEKLAELGKDITLDFVYDNVNYLMTVPGDYDLPSLANEDGWAGFMYLLSIFGGQIVE